MLIKVNERDGLISTDQGAPVMISRHFCYPLRQQLEHGAAR